MAETRPRGVAIVGASDRNFFTQQAIANLRGYAYAGEIWPINPRYSSVAGLTCYPTLDDLPGDADALMLAVAGERCKDIVARAVALGIPEIVVVSDGFAERGRRDLEDELVAVLKGSKSRMYGPNCVGFVDLASGISAMGATLPLNARAGRVSFVSQSGSLVSAFMCGCVEEGVGLDWCVSLGNGADVDLAAALQIAIARDTTRVVCVYAESLGREPEAVARALAQARALDKWVIVLKAGSSKAGAGIALSHTASMVGPDRLVRAFLDRHGALRADSIEQLVRMANICALFDRRPAGGVALVGSSGGTAVMTGDLADRLDLRMARLTEETDVYLRAIAPAGSVLQNPFDITGRPDAYGDLIEMWRRVFTDPNVSLVVAPQPVVYPDDSESHAVHRESMLLFRRLAAETGTPTISTTVAIQPWTDWVLALEAEQQPGWVIGRGLETTLRALAKIFVAGPDEQVEAKRGGETQPGDLLSEAEGRELLAAIDIPIVRGADFASAEAVTVEGLAAPYAVKVIADALGHKAKLGGVRLGCVSADEVRAAAYDIAASVARHLGQEAVRGIRVEEMVRGTELLIGLQRDPALGAFLTIGLGGTLTEALDMTHTLALPVTDAEIAAALQGLRVLSGKEADIAAVIRIAARLSARFAEGALTQVQTLEINPLILTSDGPVAADVLAVRL